MKSFTYDKANQLVTSTADGKVTNYVYDAAGRLVKEGNKTYSYGYLDKILEVQENGQQIAAFDYHIDGQVAQATHGDKSENFLWDGLALIHRAGTNYINEPAITGGNPILSSKGDVMFNDMLGTTLGVKSGEQVNQVNMTAFGEPKETTAEHNGFFTGKPYIGELGYAFLFRNYRAELGKWQTKDPLGYPDGWNNHAYCNNTVTDCIDWLGGAATTVQHLISTSQQQYTRDVVSLSGSTWRETYVIDTVQDITSDTGVLGDIANFLGVTSGTFSVLAALLVADDLTVIGVADDPLALILGAAGFGSGVISTVISLFNEPTITMGAPYETIRVISRTRIE